MDVSVHNFYENIAPLRVLWRCWVRILAAVQPVLGADTHASNCTIQYSKYHFLELSSKFIISTIRCYTSTAWADNYKRQIPSREWYAILLEFRLFCNVKLCRLVSIINNVSQKCSVSVYSFEFGCASEGSRLFRNVRNYTSNGTVPLW